MKNAIILTAAFMAAAMGGFSTLRADENHDHMTPYIGSKDFQRMKSLVGQWEGSSTEGKPGDKVAVNYRLTSGGSAIVETIMPGTPHEMVTVYHDEKGKLAMTHYCTMGNQPHMQLTKATDNELDFELAKGGSVDGAKDAHMHSLDISFEEPNKVVEKWSMYDGGQKKHETVFSLARVQ